VGIEKMILPKKFLFFGIQGITLNGKTLETKSKWMDDLRAVLYALKEGWRWWEGELCYCEEWEAEDKNNGMSALARTSSVLECSMKGVYSFLKMTMEIGDDFPDGRLPTLDLKMWVSEDNTVLYSFYEKPMATNQVIQKDSAIPENIKMSSLNAEVVRRMLNTSELLPMGDRVAALDNICQKMANSGYKLEQNRRTALGGIKGYETKLARSRRGGQALHEGAAASQSARSRKKLMQKSNWFKDSGKKNLEEEDKQGWTHGREDKNKEFNWREERKEDSSNDGARAAKKVSTAMGGTKRKRGQDKGMKRKGGQQQEKRTTEIPATTVMFVEETPSGGLAKKLRAQEDRLSQLTGFRVKYVESGGTALKQHLPCTNPWQGSKCGRDNCWTCEQGDDKVQNCHKRNILYESHCTLCEDKTDGSERKKGKRKDGRLDGEGYYVGESSRSIFERAGEHIADAKKRKEDSHIRKHWDSVHPGGSMPHFNFKVVATFSDCLTRQLAECVRISLRTNVLNSKSEFSRCHVPRLIVEKTEWEEKAEERKKLEQDGKEKAEGLMEEEYHSERYMKRVPEEERQEPRPSKKRKKRETRNNWGNVLKEKDFMTKWLETGMEKEKEEEELSELEVTAQAKEEEKVEKEFSTLEEEKEVVSILEEDNNSEQENKKREDRLRKATKKKEFWRQKATEVNKSTQEEGGASSRMEEDENKMEADKMECDVFELKELVGGKTGRKRKRGGRSGRWKKVKHEENPGGRSRRRGIRRTEAGRIYLAMLEFSERLVTEAAEESLRKDEDMVRILVEELVEYSRRAGWKSQEDKEKRKERSRRRKLDWLKNYSHMDWLDSSQEEELEKRRAIRKERAERKKQDWMEIFS
jgi:hypothetical protein